MRRDLNINKKLLLIAEVQKVKLFFFQKLPADEKWRD